MLVCMTFFFLFLFPPRRKWDGVYNKVIMERENRLASCLLISEELLLFF